MSALELMSPAVQRWFSATFSAPTLVQERGWTQIAGGEHTLLFAPTGSGKTLAAFLWCLDRLGRAPLRAAGYRAVYVSPLKALAYDVERNLQRPLAGVARAAAELGTVAPPLAIDVRTGDTPMSERRRQARRPGDILITTPESLYLLLGSQARWALATAETVIIDEIHALAPNKRGVHLALSLERLAALVTAGGRSEPQRVGLSATQRPLDRVARYLGGDRPVTIVEARAAQRLDLQVVAPAADMTAALDETAARQAGALPPSERSGMWGAIYPLLLELVLAHRSTIVFANSRRLAERLAQQLCELARARGLPEAAELVRAHHGSVARHEREAIERALKAGELRAIVATSSLELGIDMGAVELVIQLESPGSVARGLQRVGRANHQVGGAPRGRIIPKQRGDLLELAAVTAGMHRGEVEPLVLVEGCLDVLAQHVVAMCAVEPWRVAELGRVVRRAAAFAALTEAALGSVLDMLSGRYPSDELAALRPRLVWDRQSDVLSARRGARLLAVTNAGTIADRGLYPVFLGEGGPRLGELDEEMVYESQIGDTFLLGASTWRIEQITRDRVLVSPAPGEPGRMPFWRGERPGRPAALGHAIGALCSWLDEGLARGERAQLASALRQKHSFDDDAAENLLRLVEEQRAAAALPSDRTLVVERFRDELGDWRVCLLCPLGARVLAPWALLLSRALEARLGYPVHAIATDDGIALRCADGAELPAEHELFPDPDTVESELLEALPGTALFAGRFRENATRALLLPRRRPGQRSPLWSQRLRAQQLLGVALGFPSFPIVLETFRECLREAFDLPALAEVLRRRRAGELALVTVESQAASPLARALAFDYVAAYLYEGDAPVAERRAAALALDRGLLRELLGERELRELLDPRALAEVEAELAGESAERHARDDDELVDLLARLGDQSPSELRRRVAEPEALDAALARLVAAGRVVSLPLGAEPRYLTVEDAGRYRDALGVRLPAGLAADLLGPVADALTGLLARFARGRGPFTLAEVAERFAISEATAEAALAPLVARGTLERGALRPGGTEHELCDAEVLRRLRRRSLARARTEVAAASPAQYARFLGRWQGAGATTAAAPRHGTLGTGLPALRAALAQLEGLPLSFRELESKILPARVPDYAPHLLDELGAIGELVWVGRAPLGAEDGRVVLLRREHATCWLAPAAAPIDELEPLPRALLEHLRRAGASFLVALEGAAPAGTDRAAVTRALWDLVWRGLVTNDTCAPLRGLGARPGRRGPAASFGGRWSLVSELRDAARPDDARARTGRLYHQAQTLLARWGVIGRQLVAVEEVALAPILEVLAHQADSGGARRGYFVEGLGGVQYATAGALDRLRQHAGDAVGEVRVLSAVDPASPWGAQLPWPSPPGTEGKAARRPGTLVVLVDGESVLTYEPRGKRAVVLTTDTAQLERAVRDGLPQIAPLLRKRSLALEHCDGRPLVDGPLAALLAGAGWRREYRRWVLER